MGLRRYLGLRKPKTYWERRQNAQYLREVFRVAENRTANARSVVDVGSNGCAYLEWFDWIPNRTSVDIQAPYCSETVRGIKANFLDWEPDQSYDLCLCLQVLEHIPNAETFSEKLLKTADHVIISVPYKWPESQNPDHVHDPVDEVKVEGWFARSADHAVVVRDGDRDRLICYFRSSNLLY